MEITFNRLFDKFLDKGFTFVEFFYLTDFYPFIYIEIPPTYVNPKEWHATRRKVMEEVYKEQLEYWNTWIDYQKHK